MAKKSAGTIFSFRPALPRIGGQVSGNIIQKEMQRTYDLYQQEKLDAEGFSKFYTPLEERRKQLEAEIPRSEAEVDILKVNNLSAEEIAFQASNLYNN